MFRQEKSTATKLLAVLMAALVLMGIIPMGAMFQAMAAEEDTFIVKLPADVSATVTLTDEADAEQVFTANTDDNFEAVFEKLDNETTYQLVISGMSLYKNYTANGIAVSAEAPLEILDTDLVKKDVQTIAFAEDSLVKVYGDAAFALVLANPVVGGGELMYISTNPKVAEIDATGNVTIMGVGTTEIKVTIAADDTYLSAEDTLTLTIEQAEGAIAYVGTAVEWVCQDIKTNELTVQKGAVGTVTYASSNAAVAKVDALTGEVTVLKPGSATITATFVAGAESNYKDAQASYEITAVKKADALSFEIVEINKTYGDANDINDTLKPTDVTGTITYTSDNEKVAVVDPATGEYTIVGAGTAVITATLAEDDEIYHSATATYTLNVAKKKDALSFEKPEQSYIYGDAIKENPLTVALQEMGGFEGPVTYQSSDASIVSVDESTGAITILKAGNVTITASIAEEANYAAASASYTVSVSKKVVDFSINETINYGDNDPDLAAQIRANVIADLVEVEQVDEIINRVNGCITYNYPAVEAGELRQVGEYKITFLAQEDACYSFNLSGSLKVENNFDASALYVVEGLNGDSWGSVANKVVIRVTDTEKYRISTNHNSSDEWNKTELEFDAAEAMNNHTFYIRDIQTEGKKKVSLPINVTFGVDGTKPTINRFDFKVTGNSAISDLLYYLTFGTFFNKEVDVTVTAADADADGAISGVEKITLYRDGEIYGEAAVDEYNMATFTLSVEDFATLKTLSAVAADKVGNLSAETYVTSGDEGNSNFAQAGNGLIQLEQIPPEITVNYQEATSLTGAEKWYGTNVNFTVTVTDSGEENSGIRSVFAKINGVTVNLSAFSVAPDEAEPTDGTYYFINGDNKVPEVTFSMNTDLVKIPAKPDGKYVVEIFAVDNAGTQVQHDDIVVYIDRDAPVITGFEFDATESIDGDRLPVETSETYGYFFTQDTNVIVTAKDVRPSAGVKHIEFYTVTKEGVRVDYTPSSVFVDTSDDTTVIVSASFTVPQGFKGQIYARAVDNVDHTTVDKSEQPVYFNPNGAAIENAEQHKDHSEVTVTLVDETQYTDNNNLPLYKWVADEDEETPDGIPVKLYVKDTFSGIRNITYKVTAPYDSLVGDLGDETEVGSYLDSVVAKGDVIDGWTVEEVDNNLVTEMSKVIYVINNSNDIQVDLSFNDRALNTSNAEPLHFSIDNTAPTIEVVYDNNTPDEQYTDVYQEDRTATITITERNFRAEDVVFVITNTDGVIPDVDLTQDAAWELVENADPDSITHVTTITYAADGDYTFDIAYKDNVENAAPEVEQHKFTLDKTAPLISVVYDNMSALNGNYFAADRIATLTIREHNFDAARVNVIILATDSATGEAVATTAPVASEWVDNGDDTHTATIAYTMDSKYTFDVEFLDMAGNSIEDYQVEEFYVDKTAPTLNITGVADKSANNGKVTPIITYSDTNFNKDAVTITLTGIHNGKVTYNGAYSDVINGQKYTYANFEEIQDVDDIYTLTAKLVDFAGNETEKTVTFSVNRFGSVYDLSQVESMIGKYLQSEQDIVFTETNVDTLDREAIKIKLTKNGTPADLVEGTDYTIGVAGGNGEWSVYTYTVNKALFADDGRYSIAIYSMDAAGNVNENIDEAKAAEISFGIDKTKPVIVPIDFESGIQYPVEVKNVSVEIKDNLVLSNVKIYLNGQEIEYKVDGETYTFDVPEATSKQDVKIVAADAAGNEFEVLVDEFLVNTNIFVRWYNNTPLFVGSIIGVVVLALALTTFILFGKKKKDEEK